MLMCCWRFDQFFLFLLCLLYSALLALLHLCIFWHRAPGDFTADDFRSYLALRCRCYGWWWWRWCWPCTVDVFGYDGAGA